MRIKLLFFLFTAFSYLIGQSQINPEGSIVEQNGVLQAKGSKIVNKNGEVTSLAGMSLFWSQWAGGYYNESCIDWLVKDWKCNIIRAAMAIESDGYLTNPAAEKAKVETVINACLKNGVYVIIDWHDHNAQFHKAEAIAFFKEMATKYGQYPNVIYEIFNEPLQVSWSNVIKPYAVEVINAIRSIDSTNLIIVGNSSWDQQPLDCANDPIQDKNIAYTFHFYVGQHAIGMSNNAISAMNKGVAVFVSEWGLWGSDAELQAWIKFMKDYDLTWCNWSVNGKVEPSSALQLNASMLGGWLPKDLTPIGLKVRSYIQNWGPAIKNKPLLRYANSKSPFNQILLHFSEPMKISGNSDTSFIIKINNIKQNIKSVSVSENSDSSIIISLENTIDTLAKAYISYAGDSIVAGNGRKLSGFENIAIGIEAVGSAPFLISAKTDSLGNFIKLKFNKTMSTPSLLTSGFEVLSDTISIIDSVTVNKDDSLFFTVFTKKFYKNNSIFISYFPGEVKSADNGKLDTIVPFTIFNASYPKAPVIADMTIKTFNSIVLDFDNPIKISDVNNSGFKITFIDTLGNASVAAISNIINNRFSLTLVLGNYMNKYTKVFVTYKNGKVTGENTIYSIDNIDSVQLTNLLPTIPKIRSTGKNRFEAEKYSDMSGIQTETTSDTNGGLNVGYIETGDWLDYRVFIEDTGTYSITLRVAGASSTGYAIIKLMDGEPKDLVTIKLPATGGWQSWKSVTTNLSFPEKGEHTLRIHVKTGGWNLNWFEFGSPASGISTYQTDDISVYPTLIKDYLLNIKLNSVKPGIVKVKISNLAGMVVYADELKYASHENILKLPSNMSQGLFLISINDSKNLLYKGKFFIQ